MAMAMVSRPSCSNPVMNNPSFSSSAQSGNCFPRNDGLWCDIDLAERYLISSQFDKAVALCTTVLRQLKYIWEPSDNSTYDGIDEDEMDIIEAAGMVLIQAFSESDRSRMIFNDLKAIFGNLAKVPSSVFLAGLCLQISAKLYLDAQLSAESFLKHWAFTALNEHSCRFLPKSDQSQKFLSLAPEKYIEIVELYCVQVLSKGLGRLDLALQWVKEADIPAEKKQDILKELDRASLSLDSKDKRDLVSCPHKVMSSNAEACVDLNQLQVEDCVESEIETRLSKQAVKEFDSHSSLKSVFLFSPVIDMISGSMAQSFANKSDYSLKWNKVLTVVNQRKATFGGAAAVFLMIAIYRQRFQLSRALGSLGKGVRHLLRTIFVGLFDFWHLAFNVQLNPLAAVQPFPPAHQLR